jgi:hypothetical protein
LGAYDLCILEEDKRTLRDECINHFSEDYNDKIKVLGPVPTTTLRTMKHAFLSHDDKTDSKLALTVSNPIYSLTKDHNNTEGYFETFSMFMSK